MDVRHVDALIIGSGPLGCTFARKFLDETPLSVLIVDIGTMLTERPGENLKNCALFQKDNDRFTGIVQAHQQLLSLPSREATLDPNRFNYDITKYPGYVEQGQNPNQDPNYNIPNASATYAIGGMFTHWTCCTPRQNSKGPRPERSTLLTDEEWESLYIEGEMLLNTHSGEFNGSIRKQAILDALKGQYYHDKICPLPLGVERIDSKKFSVKWTGADNILGENNIKLLQDENPRFCIKSQHICLKLNTILTDKGSNKIESAIVKSLLTGEETLYRAKVFVVAAGAVLTPQLLYASNIRPHALGKYLCEHPMSFCQVALSTNIINIIKASNSNDVMKHMEENPEDALPIPMDDPDPQLLWPVCEDHLLHGQIHRNSFTFGGIDPNVDPRLVLDFRWFGRSTPRQENCVTFDEKQKDIFGMPLPTFHFQISERDSEEERLMIEEMCMVATKCGEYLPGAEPSIMKPGTAFHITGTTRMGNPAENTDDCVVDTYSRVIGHSNLFIGSCGVIPTGTACNPTLSAVALAIRAANRIIHRLKAGELN